MIFCDNISCRWYQAELCTCMRLTIEHEKCMSFERKFHRGHQTDLNHEPVPYRTRNRILK